MDNTNPDYTLQNLMEILLCYYEATGKESAKAGDCRAVMMWEAISERLFSLKLLSDCILYLYCLLLVIDPKMNLTIEALVSALDDKNGLDVVADILRAKQLRELDAY